MKTDSKKYFLNIKQKIFFNMFLVFIFASGFVSKASADIPCGTMISTPGTYTLESDKTCDGTWITISASNVLVLNASNYGVTYGNTLVQNGVIFSGVNSSVSVDGITITQGLNGGHAFYKNGGRSVGVTISNNTINLNGAPANILTTGGYTYSTEVTSAIYFRDLAFTDVFEHSVNIFGNTIQVNPTTINQAYGIMIGSSGDDWISGSIHDNTITLGSNTGVGRPTAIHGVNGNSSNRFLIYNNNITMQGSLNNGIRQLGSNNLIYGNSISATSLADNTKSINIDINADNNEVYSNIITINSNDLSSSSYGVRIRGDSQNNLIHDNVIDARGQTGTFGAYCVSIGAKEGVQPAPSDNFIYNNTLYSKAAAYQFYEGSTNTQFYCNRATNSNNGPLVYFHPMFTSTPISGAVFSGETWITGGSTSVSFPDNQSNSLSGVVFCDSGISNGNVNDTFGVGGWTVTSGPCAYSCLDEIAPAAPSELSVQ